MTIKWTQSNIYRNKWMLDVDFFVTSVAHSPQITVFGWWVLRSSGDLLGHKDEFVIRDHENWENVTQYYNLNISDSKPASEFSDQLYVTLTKAIDL